MEGRKIGRPKGKKNSNPKVYKFSFDGALKGMKQGDVLYTRQEDKAVTSRTATLGLSGAFKTERVIVVHMKSGETERGVLITKL